MQKVVFMADEGGFTGQDWTVAAVAVAFFSFLRGFGGEVQGGALAPPQSQGWIGGGAQPPPLRKETPVLCSFFLSISLSLSPSPGSTVSGTSGRP